VGRGLSENDLLAFQFIGEDISQTYRGVFCGNKLINTKSIAERFSQLTSIWVCNNQIKKFEALSQLQGLTFLDAGYELF